jgi:hypothetical protein
VEPRHCAFASTQPIPCEIFSPGQTHSDVGEFVGYSIKGDDLIRLKTFDFRPSIRIRQSGLRRFATMPAKRCSRTASISLGGAYGIRQTWYHFSPQELLPFSGGSCVSDPCLATQHGKVTGLELKSQRFRQKPHQRRGGGPGKG